ncbi:MAG: hypothetical protein ACOYT7_00120 [Patescibacteria group bacterium]
MALGWRKEYLRYKEFFLNILAVYKQKEDLKMFLEILLSLATISFFAVFALRPTLVTIAALVKEVKSKEEIVAKLDTKIQNLQTAQSILESEITRIPIIEDSVPSSAFPETFVRQLEGLATKNGVSLLGISISQITLVGEVKEQKEEGITPLPEGAFAMPFSVSVAGDFVKLSSFLNDLEKIRRPISIDTTGITVSETEEGKVLVILVSGRVPYVAFK